MIAFWGDDNELGDISGSGLRDATWHIESLSWFKKSIMIPYFVLSYQRDRKIMICTRLWDELRSLIINIVRAKSSQSARDTKVYRKRVGVTQTPKLSRFICWRKQAHYLRLEKSSLVKKKW